VGQEHYERYDADGIDYGNGIPTTTLTIESKSDSRFADLTVRPGHIGKYDRPIKIFNIPSLVTTTHYMSDAIHVVSVDLSCVRLLTNNGRRGGKNSITDWFLHSTNCYFV
jgi:hypothetical protein